MRIGKSTFAVAVLETTSVVVAVMMLTIKFITHTGKPRRATRYCTSQVENPERNRKFFILNQFLLYF